MSHSGFAPPWQPFCTAWAPQCYNAGLFSLRWSCLSSLLYQLLEVTRKSSSHRFSLKGTKVRDQQKILASNMSWVFLKVYKATGCTNHRAPLMYDFRRKVNHWLLISWSWLWPWLQDLQDLYWHPKRVSVPLAPFLVIVIAVQWLWSLNRPIPY